MTSPDTGRAGEVRVALPWPDKHLSPNARCHWAVKARAVSGARTTGRILTMQAFKLRRPRWDAVSLHWEFHPKTRVMPDSDNAQASCKAFRDGIADAIGIDDSKFQTTYSMAEPVKGGAVIVTIRGIE